jgi:hypothetical protein
MKDKPYYKTISDKHMELEKDNQIQIKRLGTDANFYTNVFKKNERIVSAVLYVLSYIKETRDNETYIITVREHALKTHTENIAALDIETHHATDGLRVLQSSLVGLESTVRLAEAIRLIPSDVAHLFYEQLVGVQRYIQSYYSTEKPFLFIESSTASRTKTLSTSTSTVSKRRTHTQIPKGDISTDAYLVYSTLTDRASRITTVLEAKPQATIKDIAEIITDVSEKTIQRELNSLIEKGQVVREGERRWSKYSVKK